MVGPMNILWMLAGLFGPIIVSLAIIVGVGVLMMAVIWVGVQTIELADWLDRNFDLKYVIKTTGKVLWYGFVAYFFGMIVLINILELWG